MTAQRRRGYAGLCNGTKGSWDRMLVVTPWIVSAVLERHPDRGSSRPAAPNRPCEGTVGCGSLLHRPSAPFPSCLCGLRGAPCSSRPPGRAQRAAAGVRRWARGGGAGAAGGESRHGGQGQGAWGAVGLSQDVCGVGGNGCGPGAGGEQQHILGH